MAKFRESQRPGVLQSLAPQDCQEFNARPLEMQEDMLSIVGGYRVGQNNQWFTWTRELCRKGRTDKSGISQKQEDSQLYEERLRKQIEEVNRRDHEMQIFY